MADKKGILTIEKELKGWATNYGSSREALEAGDRQYYKGQSMNMFRPGLIGHIAPGEVFTALTDAGSRVTELPLNIAGTSTSTGEVFMRLRNSQIVQFGLNDDTIDTNYTISHGGHTITTSDNSDIIVIKDPTGVEYLLYSFEDTTDSDVGVITSAGGSQDDDWFSTRTGGAVLTKSVPHMMTQGTVFNNIFITNGQYVATAVITGDLTVVGNVTISTQGFNLGIGWIASSIVQYKNWIAIAGYRNTSNLTSASFPNSSGQCRVWLWDGSSANADYIIDLEDNYVSAIINDNGILKAFTNGRNNTTKIHAFTGSKFDIIYENNTVEIGLSPRHGSVAMHFNVPHWGASAGQFINAIYGSAFHQKYSVTDSIGTSTLDIGFVKNLYSNILYVGAKTGASTWKIYKINNNSYALSSNFRSRLYSLPYLSMITKITVYFSQFGTGASALFTLIKDYNSFSFGGSNDLLNKTITNAISGAITSTSIPIKIPDVNTFSLSVQFNHASVTNTAAIIRKIEIEYQSQERF